MIRRVKRLLVAVTGSVAALACSLALAGTAAAQAAPKPKPAAPTGVDITGERLDAPLKLRTDVSPNEVNLVIDQVKWLGTTGQLRGPAAKDLGPKYTVLVLAAAGPQRTYDLFPLAKGGPRIYRPGKQPDSSSTRAGWFFGRLNMPETLRSVGVPMPAQFDTLAGGVGGGGERVLPEEALDPVQDLDTALGELQRLLLLNVGVVLVITAGLAGIALLVRRRTR